MAVSAAMRRGDLTSASALASHARREHPDDAVLAHMAGNIALKSGDAEGAAACFASAVKARPDHFDYVIDHAIALQRLGSDQEAIASLARHEAAGLKVARYANVRAASHRALGDLAAAARWYDIALSLNDRHPLALHGRARVALERSEPTALGLFDRALAVNPGDANLWLGKANALDIEGDHKGAILVARQIVDQAPGFMDGLSTLARMRLAQGEEDFASHYNEAARKQPQNPNIPMEHCQTLEGAGRSKQAADVAARAQRDFPDIAHFSMLEALHLGSAGEWDAAETIFAKLEYETPQRHLHEARHRLRGGTPDQAQERLTKVLKAEPWDIAAWALLGLAWRAMGDPRKEWLHEQAGLVNFLPLQAHSTLTEEAIDHLRELHGRSPFPLGQSLRGGTQTRAKLFDYASPILQQLGAAILATLEDYRSQLPGSDTTHPLLRHREEDWRFDGSWSVRLAGGGDHHAAHIHPAGIISSALYLVVPDAVNEEEHGGWLEIGRPAPNLNLDLEPLRIIKPKAGHLALFPSTLYHGTTPFEGGERMTVAFDVIV